MSEISRIPIIKVWRLLLVPLQGEIEDEAAAQLSFDVLERVSTSEVQGLIVDVTGLWLMDSHLCSVLTRLARSASLMGARTVLCGMNAETAMTLQAMGLELEGFESLLSLEQALEHYGVYSPWSHQEEDGQDSDVDGLIWRDESAALESRPKE